MDHIVKYCFFSLQIVGGVNTHQANRRIDGIAKYRQDLTRHFHTVKDKIRKPHAFTLIRDLHIERCRNIIKVAQQIHCRRKGIVVKQNGTETTVNRIVHIQMQQTNSVLDIVDGTEGNQFVVNLCTSVHDPHFRKIHDIIPLFIRFHQQFGGTGIDWNGLMEIVGRNT